MAKYNFTIKQFNEIRSLLKRRFSETSDQKKITRAKIRKLGFKISDYHHSFTDQDFQGLLNSGVIRLVDSPVNKTFVRKSATLDSTFSKRKVSVRESLLPIVDANTKILVLGTMPGENSLSYQQYYNNPNNQFWKIIFSIFNKGVVIDNYNKRIELLKKHRIGLWDVLQTCDREGSSDTKIKNPIVNDFTTFFNQYSNIDVIIFNGKDSFIYFKKFIKINLEKSLAQLNSTSSLNSHRSIDQKIEEWKEYLKN